MDRHPAAADCRIVARPEPGVWIGAVRRIIGPIAEVVQTVHGDAIENHPPQYLVAMWAPLRDDEAFLRRWPDSVSVAVNDHEGAVAELLCNLPEGARLWVTPQEVDWAVIAEIAMLSEGKKFTPDHYREIERFIAEERAATLATISANYTDHESGFEGFLGTLQSPFG
ncbi:MAG: hypothetical protein WA210_20500 [Burkholderiaceae bacterium]